MLQIIHHLFTTAALATSAPAPQPAAVAPQPAPVVTPRRLANGSPACGNVGYKYGYTMACK